MAKPVDVTSPEELRRAVEGAEGGAVLYFWQKGCEPCEASAPQLEELAREHPELTVIKVEDDGGGGSKLCDAYGVQGTPTLFVAKDAKAIEGCVADGRRACGRKLRQVGSVDEIPKVLKR